MLKKLIVGTRGSLLATTQTGIVIEAIRKCHPGIDIETRIIKTRGDIDLETSLNKMGKGIFVTEIEQALHNKEIDIAIHSMKDMPTVVTEGLKLLPMMKREMPQDVLVTRLDVTSIKEMPEASIIGTGSKRRIFQLERLIDGVMVKPIRGNVDTRIKKMLMGAYDGIVLAGAGVNRLSISSCKEYRIIPLTLDEMVPAPAQGILGLQIRSSDDALETLVKPLMDETTCLQASAERTFLNTVEGGCHMPVGAYLDLNDDLVTFTGLFGDEEGHVIKRIITQGTKDEAIKIAKQVANELLGEVNNE